MTDDAASARIGFLYPDFSAEDDYPRLAARLRPAVEAVVVHTSIGEDAHRVDALLDTGAPWRLREGAAKLAAAGVRSAVWACTSGSFVYGLAGARDQARGVADATGVPASSTSLAFVAACQALGITRVAIAATYPDEIAALFEALLGDAGIGTVRREALGIITGVEVGTVDRDRVIAHAVASDAPSATAVLMPDTALHTVDLLEALETAVGKPVLTANQVTVWEGLRLAGLLRPQDGLGTLFRAPVPSSAPSG
jgi:maleate cis-trans isomerase